MRAFIAVDLDTAIRQRLAAAQERLRGAGCTIKWVRPDRMHLTLKFLGEIDPGAVGDVADAMAAATEVVAPFELRLLGLGSFPPRGAPRVVWAGVVDASGQLAALHKRLERELGTLGFEGEPRAFRPHLTLGRVKEPRGGDRLRAAVGAEPDVDLGGQTVEELVLFESVLSSQGPTYTALRRAPLSEG